MAGCKSSVRYKVHKNVDSQIGPPLDVDMHREGLRSIPLKPITPRSPQIPWMIPSAVRRLDSDCDAMRVAWKNHSQ